LSSDVAPRLFIWLFCSALLYALTQTVFKVPLEAYENEAYRRVSKGFRNPRRIRDAQLRISFLTLSLALGYPVVLVYVNLHLTVVLLSYALIVLTTVVLYLLACDPLPPCAGTVREWLRGWVRTRTPVPSPESQSSRAARARTQYENPIPMVPMNFD
jgi:hypothetical protein